MTTPDVEFRQALVGVMAKYGENLRGRPPGSERDVAQMHVGDLVKLVVEHHGSLVHLHIGLASLEGAVRGDGVEVTADGSGSTTAFSGDYPHGLVGLRVGRGVSADHLRASLDRLIRSLGSSNWWARPKA